MATVVEVAEEPGIEYTGQLIEDQETISRHALELDPDVFIAPGIARHAAAQAMVESKDDTAMSATFAIVTRGKDPNRYNRFIQIVENEYGKGLRIDEYESNPIVLYDHGFGGMTLPIGLSAPKGGQLSVKLTKSKAVATCYFSRLPHAEPIYAAVSEGLLRMASIGFMMLKVMMAKTKGEQALPEGVMPYMECRAIDVVESMLTEWSITALGADAGALRQAIERGKIHDVRLPQWMMQSWKPYAEQPKTQVQGTGSLAHSVKVDRLNVTIAGEQSDVQRAVSLLEQPQVGTITQPAIQGASIVPILPFDAEALARSVAQHLPAPTLQECAEAAIAVAIQSAVAKAFDPVQAELTATERRLQQMTGRLD
jgi:hypothetical protein